MGRRGPASQFPQRIWCNFSREQLAWLTREAVLSGRAVNEVIREAVEARMAKTEVAP